MAAIVLNFTVHLVDIARKAFFCEVAAECFLLLFCGDKASCFDDVVTIALLLLLLLLLNHEFTERCYNGFEGRLGFDQPHPTGSH